MASHQGSERSENNINKKHKVIYVPDHELHIMAGALHDTVCRMGRETVLSRHFGKLLRSYIMNINKQRHPIYDVKRKATQLRHDLKVERARFARFKQAWKVEKQALLDKLEEHDNR